MGRLQRMERERMLYILEIIGKLIGFTRQLDTQMMNDEVIGIHLKYFFEQIGES